MNYIKKLILAGFLGIASSYAVNAQTARINSGIDASKSISYGPNVEMGAKSSVASKFVDFDGDGNLDRLLITNRPFENKADLYLCSNFGKREKNNYIHLASVPISNQTGASFDSVDIDGDGDLDIVITSKNPFSNLTSDYLFEQTADHKLKNVRYFD